MHHQHHNRITGAEAAALLNVSRRTIYRWIDEGRLPYPLTRTDIEARMPQVRQRGPKRNPLSRRYTIGRHRFERKQP
jgi:excisionase family DNA binding protein